jgi:hypothetical protein
VFDPVAGQLGDEVRVDFEGRSTPGEPTGTASGEGIDNLPLQSYTDRFSEYQNAALDSLDRLLIPSALQDLVRQYFTELEP